MIPTLLYTHSSYKDVLDVFMNEYSKVGLSSLDITICSNSKDNGDIVYDENLSYTDRLSYCLEEYPENHFLFLHEDFILYGNPNYQKLMDKLLVLKEDRLDFIRLIRSGDSGELKPYKDITNLFHTGNFFAIQAMLVSKKFLLKVLDRNKGTNIWDLEIRESSRESRGVFYYDNEPSRGGHFDSSIFPYMATAIVKGKWNSEYYRELNRLNIDFSIRGWR